MPFVDLCDFATCEFCCFVLLVLEISRIASGLSILLAPKDSRLILIGLTRLDPTYELIIKAGKLLFSLIRINHLT